MPTLAEERKALVDEVVRRWNAEERGGAIAMAVGVTRSTVMGIVSRAKAAGRITRRATPTPPPRRTKPVAAVAPATVPLPPPPLHGQNSKAAEAKAISAAPCEATLPAIHLPPPPVGPGPKTLIDAPLFTCRVVVGQNDRGQDLYCCEPTYRMPDGTIARISCCEAHKPRMFSKHRNPTGDAPAATAGAIDRLSTTFQREQRPGKKFFAFGKALEDRHD